MRYCRSIRQRVVEGLFLLVCFALLPGFATAQSRITKIVLDADTRLPLASANVFLDGTTRGTATDDRGDFTMRDIVPGSCTVVVSMVGYRNGETEITLQKSDRAPRTLEFELQPRTVELKGVTVEGSRETWLDRLDQFRESFFGTVPEADSCEFDNPEVLSFEQTEEGLVAHAEQPLRVRNEALGYEVTYHVSRYQVTSDSRSRYGSFEFDALDASSEAQAKEWRQARRRAYRGSFRHFVEVLEAGALGTEGFRVYQTTVSPTSQTGDDLSMVNEVSEAAEITESWGLRDFTVLTIPRGDYLKVDYVREEEHPTYAQLYRDDDWPGSKQTSWVRISGSSSVLIDTQSGDFVRRPRQGFGTYVLRGYWGWSGTAATALPGNYQPSSLP